MSESTYQQGDWYVPLDYDYGKSTKDNYSSDGSNQEYYGTYTAERASRDHDYHGGYTRERQLFQGVCDIELLRFFFPTLKATT